jgi:hypothetical protein
MNSAETLSQPSFHWYCCSFPRLAHTRARNQVVCLAVWYRGGLGGSSPPPPPEIPKLGQIPRSVVQPNKNTGFTHLQIEWNPWIGGYRPQISVLSVLNWICWTLPPEKIPGENPPPPEKNSGYATAVSACPLIKQESLLWAATKCATSSCCRD